MASALSFPGATAPRRDIKATFGTLRWVLCRITFSGTYTTGGEAFDPAASNAGLVPSNASILQVLAPNVGGYDLEWDKTNKKLKAWTSGGTELANANAALAGLVCDALVAVQA